MARKLAHLPVSWAFGRRDKSFWRMARTTPLFRGDYRSCRFLHRPRTTKRRSAGPFRIIKPGSLKEIYH